MAPTFQLVQQMPRTNIIFCSAASSLGSALELGWATLLEVPVDNIGPNGGQEESLKVLALGHCLVLVGLT